MRLIHNLKVMLIHSHKASIHRAPIVIASHFRMSQMLIGQYVILKDIGVFVSFDQHLHSSRLLLHLLDKLIDMCDLIFDLQVLRYHSSHHIYHIKLS